MIYTAVSFATFVMLTGCVIPFPPIRMPGTRGNVGGRVPEFIIPGITTREDVLMGLGEADNLSADQSELYYVSGRRSGVGVFVGVFYGYAKEIHRTLTIGFDGTGVVKSTRIETEVCSEYSAAVGQQYGEKRSCSRQ
jgi:hypothetical protein